MSKDRTNGERKNSGAKSADSGTALARTEVRNRKAIAAGAGAGLMGVAGAAFAAGLATAKARSGPLTRLTHGRI